jgi:hypothetical protein
VTTPGDLPDGPPPAGAGLVAPLTGRRLVEWERFCSQLLPRASLAQNFAAYGVALAEHFSQVGPPHSSTALDAVLGDKRATDLLGRTVWNERDVAARCGRLALGLGPVLLVPQMATTRFSRGANFTVFCVSARFADGKSVPVAVSRSHGPDVTSEDAVIAELLECTLDAAGAADTSVPLIVLDFWLADYVLDRLGADGQAFAAAVEPYWVHEHYTPLDRPPLLTGTSPRELFSVASARALVPELPAEQHWLAVEHEATAVRLSRLMYLERPTGDLFLVAVPGPQESYYVVRPTSTDAAHTHQLLPGAAELSLVAHAAGDSAAIASYGFDVFRGTERADPRWRRHAACLQALLTFDRAERAGRLLIP